MKTMQKGVAITICNEPNCNSICLGAPEIDRNMSTPVLECGHKARSVMYKAYLDSLLETERFVRWLVDNDCLSDKVVKAVKAHGGMVGGCMAVKCPTSDLSEEERDDIVW